MKYLNLFTCFFFLLTLGLHANDGAYYVNGNQLIPIAETDISVKKEILAITRKADRMVEVSVYYEFYNPGKEKLVTVGFEASSPRGDADVMPKNGAHPYIFDFTVNMNNNALPYRTAIVEDSLYYQGGQFKTLGNERMNELLDEGRLSADFFYVYYFDARFKEGLNIIKHTYTCQLSGGIGYLYSFHYVLTAAMRWANKQIDDFTLIVDMGEYQQYEITKAAFGKLPDWKLQGRGRIDNSRDDANPDAYFSIDRMGNTLVQIHTGKLIYEAKNFKPKDELLIFSARPFSFFETDFNYRTHTEMPFNLSEIGLRLMIDEADEEKSRRILRNFPFARRGYIFSTSYINDYYQAQPWYIADPAYQATVESLTAKEQEWVKEYSD